MNIKKNLLLSALAALGLGSASASVTYVTGSTAFEKIADNAMSNFVSTNNGSIVASDGAWGSETNIILKYGTPATNYIIAHWSGSEAGVQAIDAPTNNTVTVTFFGTNTPAVGVNGSFGGTNYVTNAANAQIAFSDTFVTASMFRPGAHAGDGRTYGNPSRDINVAAQGFAWFGSSNFPASNITSQQIRSLYNNGYLSLAFFTGLASDKTNAVFNVGRNPDSGTRIQAMAESGVGAVSQVSQDYITNNTVVPYPGGTVDGITFGDGNNGYGSTGDLLAALQATYPVGTGFDPTGLASGDNTGSNFVVGYAAATKIGTASTVSLTYNGTACTTANIINGRYTFWGYEHVMNSPYYADAAASNVATGICNYILGLTSSQLGAGNASLTDAANVNRTSDGGIVSQNY
jgi:hypothetical protein